MKQHNNNTLTKAPLLHSSAQNPLLIAGPCSAETEEQVLQTALQLKALNKVHIFRAGIWKPRTRPNSFEGVGVPGLGWLRKVKELTGLPVACEVANSRHVDEALAHGVDVLWIGARTTVNPFSVQEIADALQGTDACVLVKNPVNPDLVLWVGAMERLVKAGVSQLGAIHRGFSTHKGRYRNAPKWNLALAFRKEMPGLPLLCDPSHIGGQRDLLQELSQHALDMGMDGLMIESHIAPERALSDAQQQLTPAALAGLLESLRCRQLGGSAESPELQELADEIDVLDNELLELLSQRTQISGKMASHSPERDEVGQALRWQALMDKLRPKAQLAGLEESFIQSVFAQVHAYSCQPGAGNGADS